MDLGVPCCSSRRRGQRAREACCGDLGAGGSVANDSPTVGCMRLTCVRDAPNETTVSFTEMGNEREEVARKALDVLGTERFIAFLRAVRSEAEPFAVQLIN